MSIYLTEILVSCANFLIFFLIIRKFFFKKIQAAMDERNNSIRQSFDAANADRAAAQKLIAEAKENQRTAKETGIQIIKQYKAKAEALYEDIVSDARVEAKLILARGTVDADRERDQAIREMRRTTIELATLLSKKAIGEDASEATHDRLVDDIIGRIGEV